MKTVIELNNTYPGEGIWIVCTGTSLRDFPFELLAEYVTIGTNDAVLFFDPTVHIFNDQKCCNRYTDSGFWRRRDPWRAYGNDQPCPRREGWRYRDGQIVATRKRCAKHFMREETGPRLDLYWWEHAGPDISWDKAELYCRCTVAAAAFQLAVRMGASWIGILGADCYRRGPQARYFWQNFNEKDPVQFQGTDGGGGDYAKDWRTMREWLEKVRPGIQVVNYSPLSPNNVWPKADWREIFPTRSDMIYVGLLIGAATGLLGGMCLAAWLGRDRAQNLLAETARLRRRLLWQEKRWERLRKDLGLNDASDAPGK